MSGHEAARHISAAAIGVIVMLASLNGQSVNAAIGFAAGVCSLMYAISALNKGD